jgi:hypothetical protein
VERGKESGKRKRKGEESGKEREERRVGRGKESGKRGVYLENISGQTLFSFNINIWKESGKRGRRRVERGKESGKRGRGKENGKRKGEWKEERGVGRGMRFWKTSPTEPYLFSILTSERKAGWKRKGEWEERSMGRGKETGRKGE